MIDVSKTTLARVNQYLDWKMGLIGAIWMGSIVFWINQSHGYHEASIAAGKQFIYTFLFGGLFVKMAENIALSQDERWRAVILGGMIPMLLTSLLTFVLHLFKGTPEPIHSTIPTILFSWLSFSTWSWIQVRRQH